MRVISKTAYREFCEIHPRAAESFAHWADTVKSVNWRNWAELRATFPSADLCGKCVVFNIGGRHYRMISFVYYFRQNDKGHWMAGRIYIRNVLTHADYDKGGWKAECECGE